MTYTEHSGAVTLEMTRDDFDSLLLALGYAAGAASKEPNKTLFWKWIRLANQVNAGNPNFRPYEIPEEFHDPSKP